MSKQTTTQMSAKGPLARLVTRVFFRTAQVAGHVLLTPSLHHITLQGEGLKGVSWTAGDKIQIRLGSGLQTRTYTPIEWDPLRGITRFVAQTLSTGPGSDWVKHAKQGNFVELMGPCSSLSLATTDPRNVVLLGDETAFGLTLAWGAGRVVLEVDSPEVWGPMCHAWGLPVALIAKQSGGAHWSRMEESGWASFSPQTHFALSGRARTIQHFLKVLRAKGISSDRIRTKAYWADGKTGLD